MIEIFPIEAFSDNYIWAITDQKLVVVVDPGDANPVFEILKQRNLILAGILVTHYHQDHIGGISTLVKQNPDIPVWTPAKESVAHSTCSLMEGDTVTLPVGDIALQVLDVPAHTNGHIAYHGILPTLNPLGGTTKKPFLLCGDTLFSSGCGRLFEGTPAQMLAAMKKFSALPDNTLIYCTHEYTLSNLAFAMATEPENSDIQQRIMEVTALRGQNKPSIPCVLANEKKVNPFLRWDSHQLISTVTDWADEALEDELAVFAATRRWKDNF